MSISSDDKNLVVTPEAGTIVNTDLKDLYENQYIENPLF